MDHITDEKEYNSLYTVFEKYKNERKHNSLF